MSSDQFGGLGPSLCFDRWHKELVHLSLISTAGARVLICFEHELLSEDQFVMLH